VSKDVTTIQRQTWCGGTQSSMYCTVSRGGDIAGPHSNGDEIDLSLLSCSDFREAWRISYSCWIQMAGMLGDAQTRCPIQTSCTAGGHRNVEAEISAQHGIDSFGSNNCVVMGSF
jgi:hypothetical protein